MNKNEVREAIKKCEKERDFYVAWQKRLIKERQGLEQSAVTALMLESAIDGKIEFGIFINNPVGYRLRYIAQGGDKDIIEASDGDFKNVTIYPSNRDVTDVFEKVLRSCKIKEFLEQAKIVVDNIENIGKRLNELKQMLERMVAPKRKLN